MKKFWFFPLFLLIWLITLILSLADGFLVACSESAEEAWVALREYWSRYD